MDMKDKIRAYLENAGIEHDARLSAENLLELVSEGDREQFATDVTLTQQSTPPPGPVFTCKVLRDYWDAEGVRIPKGAVADFGATEAIDGVEAGALERVK